MTSSADGSRLVAIASGDYNAEFYIPESIYVSNDHGLTWTRRGQDDAWTGVLDSIGSGFEAGASLPL